jgi:hypothetical protein
MSHLPGLNQGQGDNGRQIGGSIEQNGASPRDGGNQNTSGWRTDHAIWTDPGF